VRVFRERPGFVEAEVRLDEQSVLLQWARDSAFRFYPLVAASGVRACAASLRSRHVQDPCAGGTRRAADFIDTLSCGREVQPLGYLAWAACGKDPGFSPSGILDEAARTSRYTEVELRGLDFSEKPPDAADLARSWRTQLDEARQVVAMLPPEQAGRAVLDTTGRLFTGGAGTLHEALVSNALLYHAGSIRGAFPTLA